LRIFVEPSSASTFHINASTVGFSRTDAQRVSELVADVGDVEVLVNNAGMASLGVLDPTGPLEDMATTTWAGSLDRNLTTAFYVTRACLRGMRQGYIVLHHEAFS
jgi:NAD(P)-dependent dehydrogenase (short-subunit alcohol dehydrogenase family)